MINNFFPFFLFIFIFVDTIIYFVLKYVYYENVPYECTTRVGPTCMLYVKRYQNAEITAAMHTIERTSPCKPNVNPLSVTPPSVLE